MRPGLTRIAVSALALAVCLAVAERAVAQGEQEVEELTAVEATEEPTSEIWCVCASTNAEEIYLYLLTTRIADQIGQRKREIAELKARLHPVPPLGVDSKPGAGTAGTTVRLFLPAQRARAAQRLG